VTGYGLGPSTIPWAVARWEDLGELMEKTRSELGDAGTAGLAPSVRTAAAAFLTAWSGYAGESRAMADGFVAALHTTDATYTGRERLTEEQLKNLDGRLGPAR
jgi:hypothetical protein